MTEFSWLSAFLIGLAGSVHCAGMCGGIVASFSFTLPQSANKFLYMLAYNSGRIFSYSLAGAAAGLIGSAVTTSSWLPIQTLTMLSGVFMVLLALYIGNWWRVLVHLEQAGKLLWNVIRPISKRFIPFKSPWQAVPYGMIWGWLPCGLVYSSLTWSMSSGSAALGALNMLCFGLGTLPAMLSIGASSQSFAEFARRPAVKHLIAAILFIYGLLLIGQAVHNW